jgi:YfiH family protein
VSVGSYRSLDLGLHVGDDPSAVLENRRRVAGSVGFEVEDLVFAEQVHGAGVAVVGEPGGVRAGADALVTAVPRIPLVTLAADCVLAGLHDPAVPAIGVAHAGWRGLVAGVLEATVEALAGLGARPERIEAALSPAIGPCCFEVGDEVVNAVGEAYARSVGGRTTVDLRAAAAARLIEAGVDPARIVASGECTVCRSEDWFSHRGMGGRPTGRHGLVVWLEG